MDWDEAYGGRLGADMAKTGFQQAAVRGARGGSTDRERMPRNQKRAAERGGFGKIARREGEGGRGMGQWVKSVTDLRAFDIVCICVCVCVRTHTCSCVRCTRARAR